MASYDVTIHQCDNCSATTQDAMTDGWASGVGVLPLDTSLDPVCVAVLGANSQLAAEDLGL